MLLERLWKKDMAHPMVVQLGFAVLLAFLTVHSTRAESSHHCEHIGSSPPTNKSRRSTVLLDKLMCNMDSRIRPDADGAPVQVEVGFYVISFGSISESDMDYSVDIYLRQKWIDDRLDFIVENPNATKPLTLTSQSVKKMWIPDLFFPNEKDASFHMATVPNQLMRVYPNGTVTYSQRLTLKLSCPMILTHFPMDTQVCRLLIESFGYDLGEMRLTWMNHGVEVNENLELPQFEMDNHNLTVSTSKYHTGSFSSLTAKFDLHRNYGYYLLQTYVPSILIVILSWIAFWINHEAVPARISLGVTTVLTMTTQFSGARVGMPRVSYPKAIDVWMATCMVFVFAALVEYAIVNVIARKESNTKRKEQEKSKPLIDHESKELEANMKSKPEDFIVLDPGKKRSKTGAPDWLWCFRNKNELARGIDKLSRVLFPGVFMVFNCIYWPMYLAPR